MAPTWAVPGLFHSKLYVMDNRIISVQGSYYSKKVKGFQDALGVANTTAEESLSNIRTIRSFACDEKACENYNKDIDNSLKVGSSLAFVYGMFQGIISLLIQVSIKINKQSFCVFPVFSWRFLKAVF